MSTSKCIKRKIGTKHLLCVCLVLALSSCGSTRKAEKSIDNQVGTEVVVSIPLKSQHVYDTKTHFRSVGSGTSADWNVARNIALTNCRGDMIAKLNAFVKTAMENYSKQYAAVDESNLTQRDLGQSFEQYTLVFSEGNLRGVNELENVITRNSNTLEYTHWIALEITKDAAIDEAVKSFDKLSADVKQTIGYDRDRFRAYVEENY